MPRPFSSMGGMPLLSSEEYPDARASMESAMPLKGKVAIVTGGSSGIGQAIVLELARQHDAVVIDFVCHPEATEALEQEVSKLGDQSIGVEADVSKFTDLQ